MGEYKYSLSIRFGNVDNRERWLTGIYGPNNSGRRKECWIELIGLYGLCSPNWCLDFFQKNLNGIFVTRGILILSLECSLVDPPLLNAPRFTWSNL